MYIPTKRSPHVRAYYLNTLYKLNKLPRMIFTCPNYNLNIFPSPARTISTSPIYIQSHLNVYAQYDFNKRDDASQSNINMICNHLSYHKYMGLVKNTITHNK